MAFEQINVCYSVIEPDSLKIVLNEQYGFNYNTKCYLYRSSINDVYFVKTDDAVYYLRIANNGARGLTLIDYEEEINIMISINDNGVSTAAPVPCRNGKFVWAINAPEGIRYAVLFVGIKSNPSDDHTKSSYSLGQALANIHTISDHKEYKISRPPIDFRLLIEKPLSLLRPYLEPEKPYEFLFICNSLERLREYITEKLSLQKPFYGFCHGDISGNVFFQGEIPTFFDFDYMGYGWRSDEIAFYIWGMEKKNPHYKESEEYKAFIDGYNSVRGLSENEIKCINAFCAIRSIWTISISIMLFAKRNGLFAVEEYIRQCTGDFLMRYNKVFVET